MTQDRKLSLLLEIGTEEIPARFLSPASAMLKENAASILRDSSVDFSDMKTYATPRRLALIVGGIAPMQSDRIKEVFGPPKRAAFDEKGNPTKAALGFAASQGVDVSSLEIKTKDKGEYVVAVIEQKGSPVKAVLPDILQRTVLSLNFPKSMRWGDGNLRFVRPIHWILALCDGEVVPFEIDGIKSGNITKGHRFLSPGAFVIKEIPSYIHLMENNYVIVDQEQRKKSILAGIEKLASAAGGRPVLDEALLGTVTNLTEYPVPVACQFPPEYLVLPKELLLTVMRDHQKFFGVEDEQANLRNSFIVISNTKNENAETIRAGAERVIKARFEDARFYYEEDRTTHLHKRIDELRRVTFHDRLGSLYEKTKKVVKLASSLAGRLFPEKDDHAERAAWLSKTDLITGVVGEFPELQGLMGKYYALHDGEDRAVAEALMEQYLPAYSGDRLPATDVGAVLSLADKMDNVVSFFAIGLTPTGSEDPFALRRQALALIAILADRGYPLTLNELIGKAEEGLAGSRPSLTVEVLQFFLQRLEPLFSSQGYDQDVIQSVLFQAGDVPLSEMKERLAAITRFTADASYNDFLLAIKRVNNILPQGETTEVKTDLLVEPQEKDLHRCAIDVKTGVVEMVGNGKYDEALKLLATLTAPINAFFDGVLVMDKREEVKMNRLALLREVWTMAVLVADFSKLQERTKNS